MYIKFYKRPSCTTLLNSKAKCFEIKSVLTVTNDLGEKFFYGDLELLVELVLTSPASSSKKRVNDGNSTKETVLDSQTLKWTTGSRAVTFTARVPLMPASNAKFYVRASVPHPDQAVDMLLESYDTVSKEAIPATFLPIKSIPCKFSDANRDKSSCDSEHLALRNLETECPGFNVNIIEETKGDIASHIWDAALAVSKELCSSPDTLKKYIGTPRSIIELGAGCGFTGLVMAAMFPAAQVLLTDFEEAREACQRNIDLNLANLPKTSKRSRITITGSNSTSLAAAATKEGERVEFQPLQWEEEDLSKIPMPVYRHGHSEHEGWDVVLVTDCIYNRSSFGPLLCILEKLISPGTILLLAHKYRDADSGELFYEMLGEKFEFVHDYCIERYDERIRILIVQRREE